jgi:PAS domain S-box-containing protein
MKATLDREPVGIAILTYPELRYAYANPTMKRVLGTDPVGRLQGETFSDFPWPPLERLTRVAERGARLTSRDSRWVMPSVPGAQPEELFFTFEVCRVMVGQTVFLLATAVETTDEVEARRRMDGVIEQMQEVLDCVYEAIISLDEHWRLTFANKQAAEKFGRGRDGLLHRAFSDLFGEYEARTLEERLRPAMDERLDVDFEMTIADGAGRFRIRAFPTRAGITVYMAPLDAPDEHARRFETDERTAVLLGLLNEAVTVFDGTGRLAALNDPACEMFGKRREDLIGKSLVEAFGELDAHGWLARIGTALDTRSAFRIMAEPDDSGAILEHRGVPVEDGTIMVSTVAKPAEKGR